MEKREKGLEIHSRFTGFRAISDHNQHMLDDNFHLLVEKKVRSPRCGNSLGSETSRGSTKRSPISRGEQCKARPLSFHLNHLSLSLSPFLLFKSAP